jgi:hypothetical protein
VWPAFLIRPMISGCLLVHTRSAGVLRTMRYRIYLFVAAICIIIFNSTPLCATDLIVTKPELSELISLIVHRDAIGLNGDKEYSACLFSNSWSPQAISKEDIKKYLKINLSSDVIPVSQLSWPSEYLKLNGVPERAICDNADNKSTALFSVGFPLFNKDHTEALMTLSDSVECWAKDASGKKVRTETGSSSLLVFKKKARWGLVYTEEGDHWDGAPCAN